jgi:chromosome segregation ATPase
MMMDLLGLPFTSIVLFILAGIVLGHALWYQDRSSDIEKINWLEKRYFQARTIAQRRKLELRTLFIAKDQQQRELGTLRQRYEANRVQFNALERSSRADSQELHELRQAQQELTQQLSSELRRSDMLVNQLQEVLKGRAGLESQLRQQTEAIARLTDSHPVDAPDWNSAVETLKRELAQSRVALQHASEDLQARSADLDLLRAQRDSVSHQLELMLRSASSSTAADPDHDACSDPAPETGYDAHRQAA